MANFDHWMRLNIGDYLADTMHLNATQNGIYLLLLMHTFKRQKLPQKIDQLARIARVTVRVWKRESPQVLALFTVDGEFLIHKRINEERERAEHSSRARRRARGTRARATANPPPESSPVIDLAARRKKGGGGWADVAAEEAGE